MTTKPDWACPGSTRVLPSDATRADWLAARRSGIGASEIANVLTVDGAYQSAYATWLEKTDPDAPADDDGELLRMGRDIEDVVVARFTEQTGIATRRHGLARSKQHPHFLASVDRLTADGGVLEAKVHTTWAKANRVWAIGDVPAKFWWQGQQQLLVTGRSHVWFAAYLPGQRFTVVRVDRDVAAISRILEAGARFWWHVENRTAPPVDPLTASDEELKARWPHVIDADSVAEAAIPEAFTAMYQRRAELKAAEKTIAAELQSIDTQIKTAIGDREYLAADGRPLFRWREIAQTRFDQKRFEADCPDLAAEYRAAASYRRLDPIKDALTEKDQAA